MVNKQLLLSICIPTYNRANILDQSLARIIKEFELLENKSRVEFIISDNQSPDNTSEIVRKYIDQGLPVQYVRNIVNIGADRNFIQCFDLAKGEYLWLLGDDDFLKRGALSKIINVLEQNTYGILLLQMDSKVEVFSTQYENPQLFAAKVGFWFTFISGNIVNTKYVSQINFEPYIGSYMIQVPLYMMAALSEKKNALIHEKLLDDGMNADSNGGYNFFEVFVNNYLKLCREFIDKGLLSKISYEKIKHNLYKDFLIAYIYRLLIKKDKGNFKIDNGWGIIFSTYGLYPYFYFNFLIWVLKQLIKRLRK